MAVMRPASCNHVETCSVRSALGRLGWFANLPLGGGGLRAEAAALNNPAARRMPTAGKAPSCGGLSTGRSLHAVPGVKLPLAVILTAHRLHAPCARPGRRRQYQASTSKAKGFGSGWLALSLRSPTGTVLVLACLVNSTMLGVDPSQLTVSIMLQIE